MERGALVILGTVPYGKYLAGDYIQQKYLETAFLWAADAEGITGKEAIADYMQQHRGDEDADVLWKYFEDLFAWVSRVFGKYDKTMKGVKWGLLYNRHQNDNLDPVEMQKSIHTLIADREVQKKSGIYEYLLSERRKEDEKHFNLLNLRRFDVDEKRTMYKEPCTNGRMADARSVTNPSPFLRCTGIM